MNRIEEPIDGVDYHQYYLVADAADAYPEYPVEPSYPNRLLAATPNGHGICVSTGIAMGAIHLAVDLLDQAPTALDMTRDWEAIAEVSLEAARPWAGLQFLGTLPAETPAAFQRLELRAGEGWYRVRGHAVGRALDFDAVVGPGGDRIEPREFHLLQIWPDDGPADPVRIRDDDPWAAQ